MPPEPAPARELKITRDPLTKVFLQLVLIEVICRGHLLPVVAKPDADTPLALVAVASRSAPDFAVIGRAAPGTSKHGDGALLSPPLERPAGAIKKHEP
jgi:hypothetical protein